jgi:hypothetical protein
MPRVVSTGKASGARAPVEQKSGDGPSLAA